MTNLFYQKRKEAGLCVRCGKPAMECKVHCESCIEKINSYRKKNRERLVSELKKRFEYLKSVGICTKCGKNQALPGRNYCAECKQYQHEYNVTYRYKRYLALKNKGICTRCGVAEARPGKTLCEICFIKERTRDRIRHANKMEK